MQAATRHPRLWTPPTGALGTLVAAAERRARELTAAESELRDRVAIAAGQTRPPSFAQALRRSDVAIIAELKRRSPSKGDINPGLSAERQAEAYAAGGAAALSILTEPDHFGGSPDDLAAARCASRLPLLKKDFHVHEVQLLEARALGASAVLLIARALPPARLHGLVRAAANLSLEVLVEVRDEIELAEALDTPAAIIGVNNRDLETLRIDPSTAERLVPLIPSERAAIAESGVRSREDVERYAGCGADAVLVGSSVSASDDPVAAVQALTGVARAPRGR